MRTVRFGRREHAPGGDRVVDVLLDDPAAEGADAELHRCGASVLVLLEAVGRQDLRGGEISRREVGVLASRTPRMRGWWRR